MSWLDLVSGLLSPVWLGEQARQQAVMQQPAWRLFDVEGEDKTRVQAVQKLLDNMCKTDRWEPPPLRDFSPPPAPTTTAQAWTMARYTGPDLEGFCRIDEMWR